MCIRALQSGVRRAAACPRRTSPRFGQAVARIAWAEYESLEAPEHEREDLLDDLLFGLDESPRRRARNAAFRSTSRRSGGRDRRRLGLPEVTFRRWRELGDPPREAVAH